jgi:hypothetical protein
MEADFDLSHVRVVLNAGGPADATGQNRLVRIATAHVRHKGRAAVLAEQLALTISFHHLLAGLNDEVPGPCHEGLVVLAEIEAASRSTAH